MKAVKKILVVVDMQNDFVNGALGTKEARQIVDPVAAKIQGFEGEIFVTLDTHSHNYLETAEGKALPVPHCIRTTNGWLLNEKVREALSQKEYRQIEKNTFGSVKLAEEICRRKGDGDVEVEFVGLCTDICVVSNVLLVKAFLPEAAIRVDARCCAGVTPETHRAAIETMKMCQIEILD